ncbi:PqiB family protein [Ketobacter sp.]|uniref:PqiB family protein n=1 Tax=Ketobacter sp. TaxID=2083498 RepID=UPI000F229A23|nr:MlaD family protein [Ketobacter sp.]RLT97003.1 MAG: MCE family protein [Ketobacter sp.]
MTDQEYHEALVKESRSISIIWLLPMVAVVIGGWLLVKSLVEAPIEITIDFPSGTGMEVGKTKVIYEGITAGVVSDIRLDTTDLEGVIATVEIDRRVEPLLRESTQFWLVKPEISLSGVTGLETIVTGNYIGVKVGLTGKKTTFFKALSEPPPLDTQVPGLHLELLASDLGSLHVDAPVLFKKIVVGSVTQYQLKPKQDQVSIRIHIKPEFAGLVSKQSRFWNVSGIKASADLSGVKVQTESLLSVVQGGITFDTPAFTDTNPPADNEDVFTLYEDYEAAQRGVRASITFRPPVSLEPGKTKVMFQGFEIGLVHAVDFSEDNLAVTAAVSFHPEAEPYLTSATRFWLVKPEISLQGVSGLDTLLSGRQIVMEVKPDQQAEPQRDFVALKEAPKVDYSRPGLHLKLESAELSSVSRGTPVLYRQVAVGEVQAVSLSRSRNSVIADITIEPEYARLVNDHSRFWKASGISVSGSITKLKVRAESLTSIVQGGIAFYNPDAGSGKTVHNGHVFNLYEDYELARENGIAIRIRLPGSRGLEEGTLIKYQGFTVGEVKRIELNPDLSGVTAHAFLRQYPQQFAVQGSRFWLVQPKIGITGASNLDTLLKGQYFEVKPGTGAAHYDFVALAEPAPVARPDSGLNVVLKSPRLASIRPGLHVYYRDVVVGQVTGFELAPTADEVLVYVNIEPPFHVLVRPGTRFWNASGVNIDVGLFSGASIKTESLESILAGGISFATPETQQSTEPVASGQAFTLHSEAKEEWLQWRPKIPLQ